MRPGVGASLSKRILAAAALLWAALGASPQPVATAAPGNVPNPATWITNGKVNAIAQTSTTIYLGGEFTRVMPFTGGGVPISAASGQPVATFPRVIGFVMACVADGAGGWYIGGSFKQVGTRVRNNLAHIFPDGSVDLAWNPNANGIVYALAVSGGAVYAGGEFTSVGGQVRNNLAALDAASGVVTAWNPNANGLVSSLAVLGSAIYAGGMFTNIGGQARNYIAALAASGPGTATTWNPNANGAVATLAASGSSIYTGGSFTSIGGQARSHIAALNADSTGTATAWNPYANYEVMALAVSGSTVYIGGDFTSIGGVYNYNRYKLAALDAVTGKLTPWNPYPTGTVRALAVSGSTVFVGGDFTSIGGGLNRSSLAAVDATSGMITSWNPTAGNRVLCLAASGGTVYAGGYFNSIGGQDRNHLAAFDTSSGAVTAWDPNAENNTGYYVNALTVAGGSVFAGGFFNSIKGQLHRNLAALDPVTGKLQPWSPETDWPVYALAASGATVYVGGDFSRIGGQARYRLAALNAANGTVTPWNANANGVVLSLAVSGGTVYVGGKFTNLTGLNCNCLGALDAVTGLAVNWSPGVTSPADSNNSVRALAISDGTVYAGGYFTSLGGQACNGLAAIDAATGKTTAWNPNIGDRYSCIYALTVSGGTVYAGGSFTNIGGQAHSALAGLDAVTGQATAWNPNPQSYRSLLSANALALSGPTLYVGGSFGAIGGRSQSNFAQFDTPLAVLDWQDYQ